MAERGAQPHVPRGRRLFLRAVRRLFSPLQPDDYLEMINPLWTTKELRGKPNESSHRARKRRAF